MVKIIDLSLPIDTQTISPPSQAKKVFVEYAYRSPGWWQASTITLSAHTATHVDSPLHVIKDSITVGQLSLEKLIGDAIILNLTNKKPNSPITSEDFIKYEEKIRFNDIIILRTDWTDKKWGTNEYWDNSPYLTEDGAKWLVAKCPKAIGFDFFEEYSARLKDFKPEDFVVHKMILKEGIAIIEHLTNLGKISRERVKLYVLPLKLMVTEAAPARAIAIEE